MTDQWIPERVPILLQSRSLLTATQGKPHEIGYARIGVQDYNAMIAIDRDLEKRDPNDLRPQDRGGFMANPMTMQNRTQVEAQWLEQILDIPYQVTYYFPSYVRSPRVGSGVYGAKGLTYRVLYEALCNGFNGGRRFIDDYFLGLFEQHMRPKYEAAVNALKVQLVREARKRRGQHKAYFSNYDLWAKQHVRQTFNELALETKRDIEISLSTGMIPLQMTALSPRTVAIRQRLGISSTAVFYATGRLVRSIIVSVILLSKKTGDKQSAYSV